VPSLLRIATSGSRTTKTRDPYRERPGGSDPILNEY
jgi:hypothetical protein